jgi:hypothetical protein
MARIPARGLREMKIVLKGIKTVLIGIAALTVCATLPANALGGRHGSPDISPSAATEGSSSPYGGGAGTGEKFRRFHQDRDTIAKTGRPFRIEGHCQSACTLFLKLKNACIDPNAELLFHAGGSAHSTQVMLDSYNSKLRNFLVTNHYMETQQFHTISGREMIQKFGYRQCPGT